jgi:hypothetical protein
MCRDVRCLLMLGALGVTLTIGCSRTTDVGRESASRTGDAGVKHTTESGDSLQSNAPGRVANANGARSDEQLAAGVHDSDNPAANNSRTRSGGAAAVNSFPTTTPKHVEGDAAQAEQARKHDRDDPDAEVVVNVKAAPAGPDTHEHPLDNGRDGGDVLPGKTTLPVVNTIKGAPGASSLPVDALPLELRPPTNSDDASQPAANDQPPAPSTNATVPPVRVTAELPSQYRSLDKDKDGQIGVYEWPRDDLDTFQKLDRNRDGFLTPVELAGGANEDAQKAKSDGSKQ